MEDYVLPILMLLVGIGVGGFSMWLLRRAQVEHAYDRGKSEGEIERVTLATTLQQERNQTAEKLAVLDDAQKRLSDAFQALAAEALKSNNQQFLELAKAKLEAFQEGAKGDLEKRQQAIRQLVEPVRESLAKVDAKIQQIEVAREGAYKGLRQQVDSLLTTEKELRAETSNLVKALRRPEVRGRWGEIQLRRVVELAGMLEYCDFKQQESREGEEGRLRPDLIVNLPANKNIVVDSKTPLTAYLEAIEAADAETRTEKLRKHAEQIRKHVSMLGRKSYFAQFEPAPEFVVLFLPGEVFFSAALEQDPELIETGVNQNVIIATPTTLIALLRAVAYGWRQEQLAENAKKISDLGKELHKRLADMAQHMSRLGKSLGSATTAYNIAVGSLESRVLVSARKFKELGAVPPGSEVAELSPVETSPRTLQAPELLGQEGPSGEPPPEST
jgi:DNA recombination protein RmuC